MADKLTAKFINVKGIVQGVGFRPFVYQLASQWGLSGNVANTSAGVMIHAEGTEKSVSGFICDITEKKPPLAHITDVIVENAQAEEYTKFTIVKSSGSESRSTLISPDVSVCPDCAREMSDPRDRRYRYPFTNCTNCGPRYTIIDDIPYDRPNTSMKHFKMCEKCQAEYDNPLDRRFHAQPNACPVCGPMVALHDRDGNEILSRDPVKETARLLKKGYILAVKGLGGFHLAADAENMDAVRKLRDRKVREEKPFALMVADYESVLELAHVDDEERDLLTSNVRPIVLLKRREDASIPSETLDVVAPFSKNLGIMLPYTPLHHLLFDCGIKHLVMTSGNKSDEPISIDNEDAFEKLSHIADYFLVHNRDIYLRSDDSIVRKVAGSQRILRRSRGFAPMPVFLKRDVPQVLACGGGLKNTVCVTKENRAFLSQHIGDVENYNTYDFFKLTLNHMKRILDIDPEIIAHDLHPDYLSSVYAREQENRILVPVQHHHAHIVSCMAENRVDGPVIGLSFDGTGLGTDGNIWGGEVLISEASGFTRAAHLSYTPMPGSNHAVKEPWRMAAGFLYEAYGPGFTDLDIPMMERAGKEKLKFLGQMMEKKINSPLTSSMGRFFDGVAALMGLREKVTFEGQAAMELEMISDPHEQGYYNTRWDKGDDTIVIPVQPVISGIVEDIKADVSRETIGGKFHRTLIRLFTDLCLDIKEKTSLDSVALSGGVFQNSILLAGLKNSLELADFHVYTQTLVPASDGGLSLGQAVAAAAMVEKNR